MTESIQDACFTIMPFSDWHDHYYKHVYKAAIAEAGLKPVRADDLSRSSTIINDIWQYTKDASIVLADLSDTNPNVFYELALRHALKKPVIQLIDSKDKIPFDVSTTRTIKIDYKDLDSVAEAKKELKKQIIAVEPNPEMRSIAARELGQFPTCRIIDGRAEETALESYSVDLITAAQSVHWFEPESARRELYRILKPAGWLALCRNYGTNHDLGEALQGVFPSENDTEAQMVGKHQPRSFYYGGEKFIKMDFPFEIKLTWQAFLGSLSSASYAPDVSSSLYLQFERDARSVFDAFKVDQHIEVQGMTELYLGHIP